jgi:Tfp pilus assembly protein FimT
MTIENKSAFSVVEVIVVAIFLGVLAWIAVPRLNFAAVSRNRGEATARKIVADLRLTRRLAVTDAAINTQGFELRMVGSAPYTAYEIENIDTKVIVTSHTFDSNLNISCPTGTRFIYGPLGNLKPASATQLIVTAEGKCFTITIDLATGTVRCTEY